MKRRTRRLGRVALGAIAMMAARGALARARAMAFDGATVLITGGSRGLGLLLAREFGDKGARVAITARDAAELDRAQADLTGRGITYAAAARHNEMGDQERRVG